MSDDNGGIAPRAPIDPIVTPGYAKAQVGTILHVVTSDRVRLVADVSNRDGDLTVPPDNHLIVLADQVVVHGLVKAPNRSVILIARSVASETAPQTTGPDQPATIDVDGNAGSTGDPKLSNPTAAADPVDGQGYAANGDGNHGAKGNPGASGTAGFPGGRIQVYCNSTLPGTSITLTAKGGNGGSGQNGQNGGAGYHGQKGDDSTRKWWGYSAPTRGTNGGEGGLGGPGGNAGVGGTPGWIVFHAFQKNSPLATMATGGLDAGTNGTPGTGGHGGAGGAKGPGGEGRTSGAAAGGYGGHTIPNAADGNYGTNHTNDKADDGKLVDLQGNAVTAPDPSKAPPPATASIKAGLTAVQPYGYADPEFATLFLWEIDLESYLEMQLDKAGYDYLTLKVPTQQPPSTDHGTTAVDGGGSIATDGDSGAVGDAVDRLQWILDLAGMVTTARGLSGAHLKPNDPLFAVRRARTAHLADIATRASSLLQKNVNGLDYFGHGPGWVPTLSLDYYQTALGVPPAGAMNADPLTGSALATYVSAETHDATLRSNLQKDQDATDVRKAVSVAASAQLTKIGDDITALKATASTLLDKIKAQQAKLPNLRTQFKDAVEQFSSKEIFSTSLTFEQLFQAVGQFAFMPVEGGALALRQASLVVGQGGSVASSLLTPDPDKQFLLKQLTVVDEGVDSLDDAVQTVANGEAFSPDDLNGHMLLALQSQFDQLCQRYINGSTVGQLAHQAKTAMDVYAEAVRIRNDAILHYNATIARVGTAEGKQANLTRLANLNLDDAAAAKVQGLAESTAQADLALSTAREECLRLLYEASRAYSLVTLRPDVDFHSILGLSAPSKIASADAIHAATQLVTDRRQVIDPMMPQRPMPPTGPELFERNGGKIVKLTRTGNPDLFAGLDTGKGVVTLDAFGLSDDAAPFHGMRNVRIRCVRCWLHQLDVVSDEIDVILSHSGDSSFLTKGDILDTRHHDRVDIPFRYVAAVAGPDDSYEGVYRADLRNTTDGVLEAPNHALVSPFATWVIQLPQVTAKGPATAKLDEIHLEFFVLFDQPTSALATAAGTGRVPAAAGVA